MADNPRARLWSLRCRLYLRDPCADWAEKLVADSCGPWLHRALRCCRLETCEPRSGRCRIQGTLFRSACRTHHGTTPVALNVRLHPIITPTLFAAGRWEFLAELNFTPQNRPFCPRSTIDDAAGTFRGDARLRRCAYPTRRKFLRRGAAYFRVVSEHRLLFFNFFFARVREMTRAIKNFVTSV